MKKDAVVLGTGLIGASIGAGLRREGWLVAGWDPSSEALHHAASIGAIDMRIADPADMPETDLIVLAGPVAGVIELVGSLSTKALVTDVAGVKRPVVAAAAHLEHFVGGHPMAGRETSGPASATAAMFSGASWILTTDGAVDSDLDQMEEIVTSLGAIPVRMTAAEHDRSVAAVSHMPQVVASALVGVVGSDEKALSLAAGGFRDLTRIALSESTWWTDILAENSEAVADALGQVSEEIQRWIELLGAGDRENLTRRLGVAREIRVGLSAPVSAVRVLLEDRPGEIAEVGRALATAGADVRDLQLRHATRGGGGVLILSVRPGDEANLASALKSQGFRVLD